MPSQYVALRLTPPQAHLIRRGWERIHTGYICVQRGYARDCFPRHLGQPKRPGTFNPELMDTLLQAYRGIYRVRRSGYRVRWHFVQVAAAILGIRVGLDYARHRGKHQLSSREKLGAARLIKRFELVYARAKRGFCQIHGHDRYADISKRWRALVIWIRLETAYYRRRPAVTSKKTQQAIIDQAIKRIRPYMADRISDQRQLRRAVRLGLRYIRRDRWGVGIGSLFDPGNDHLVQRLAEFVGRRCHGQTNDKENAHANCRTT